MRILFACHKHPFRNNPRGAEKSVKIIMEYLSQWHQVKAYTEGFPEEELNGVKYTGENFARAIRESDMVFCWASTAAPTARVCIKWNIPYVLMIRWFRLIQPLPPGDLMARPIDYNFIRDHQFIFNNAFAITSNTNYVCDVIKRYYNVEAITSYVPILGKPENVSNKDGYVTIITPSQDLGEWELIEELSEHENILVVNCKEDEMARYSHLNITMISYCEMDWVFENTSILLMPVYYNDRNGQGRVTTEAHQRGIPVISNNRCGMGEIIPKEHLLSKYASPKEWKAKIKEIRKNYDKNSEISIKAFYPAEPQLKIFKLICQKSEQLTEKLKS